MLAAVYCRRDIAGVLLTLRVEFTGQDHPDRPRDHGGRRSAARQLRPADHRRTHQRGDPSGPAAPGRRQCPPRALESVAIQLAGRAPHDTELAERAVRGLLGLPPQLAPTETEIHE